MPEFLPGVEPARLFYTEAVRPLLGDLLHAAARLGPGPDVLGFRHRTLHRPRLGATAGAVHRPRRPARESGTPWPARSCTGTRATSCSPIERAKKTSSALVLWNTRHIDLAV